MLAIQQLRGETIESIPQEDEEKDLFELPDTHLRSQLPDDDNDDEIIENNEFESVAKRRQTTWSKTTNSHYVLPKFDEMDESAMKNLPVEMQHEILTDMKESLKRGQRQLEDMPKKSDDFSNYQIQKLLKQNDVSQKISSLNKAIKRQKFDIPTDSNTQIYAGKLASDASTQYVLIKSDNVQKSTSTNISQTSSLSTSLSLSRHSTSDFCADKLMERDPIESLRPRTSLNDVQQESQPVPIVEKVDDEELELAIKQSLNEVELSPVKDASPSSSSSSTDSDDGDFIEVPPLDIKMFEPFLLLGVESQQNTTNNTSSELIDLEEEEEESSHHSSIIEDLQAILDSEKDQPAPSMETTTSQVNQLDLDQLQTELISDTAVQLNTARGNERLTATLTDTMHEETQYLLRLFGIPYLVSPTEAEAQCAFLDLSGQCDGVITDDSDVWLFGANHVYRHFFHQDQFVEYYDSNSIVNQLGLDRESMIAIGMIVGSDYTRGIPNAGIITALEILQEFHGNCMERLNKFRHWWKKAQKSDYKTDSKVLKHLKNLQLSEGFPSQAVYDAYQTPKIDYDKSKFTWAMPQLELLREFIGTKLKWDRRRIDEMILPVIKRMSTHEVQSRIDSFFAPIVFEGASKQLRTNTRLRSALDLLKEKTRQANEIDVSSSDDEPFPIKTRTEKRKRTTKLMNKVLDSTQNTKRRAKKKPTGPILSDDE